VIWGEHDGVLRTAVLALKHGARDELAEPLGARLATAVALEPWADSVEIVCWVPSHPLRRIRNPWPAARLLAAAVARRLDRDLRPIMRRHGLRRQTGQTRARRRQLARTSFSASTAARDRHILLVDDVTTTGTTVNIASRALIRAGAEAVFCAVLAQTPDARRMP
jgi:predicted amidophosphoribosyltransferase